MKIKRILLTALCMVLVAVLSIAGTIAYLTSTDEDVNVMVMPGVEIAQHEYERVVDANGDPVEGVEGADFTSDYGITQSYKLQPFTQAKPAYPAVYTNGGQAWDEFQQLWNQVGAPGSNELFDDSMKNVIDKFVFVENTGKSDAYYRTVVAIECPEGITEDMIHINMNANSRFDYNDDVDGAQSTADSNEFYTTIDGVRYLVYTATYTEVLTPGEVSRPSLLQVFLDPKVDNKEVELFGETWEILVVSQAVQTVGFSDAETALDAAFGDITATTHPWTDGANVPSVASTADGLVAALEEGKSVILTDDVKIDPAGMSNAYGKTGINVKNGQAINGNGNTLDIKGAGGTWDSGINTTGGLIENITVTGSFRGIFINHNSTHSERVVLNNVTTTGTVYTISCDQGSNQGLTATDCKFYGWTSYAKTLGDAEFVDCYFGEGSGYAYMRPYAPTTFVGCDFEAGFEIDARAAVTFENCTIDGVAITADNVATLVTSNTANATVIG